MSAGHPMCDVNIGEMRTAERERGRGREAGGEPDILTVLSEQRTASHQTPLPTPRQQTHSYTVIQLYSYYVAF